MNPSEEYASGMHMVNTDNHWAYPSYAKDKDVIPGGLADGKSPSDFDQESLDEGIEVELEHTSSRDVAEEIAMDHLMEDPDYYKKLKKIEKHAIGLTGIPAGTQGLPEEDDGTHGTEMLGFKGIPQNPGLSREVGEDEETDFFGADSDIVDLPSKNDKYQKDHEYLESKAGGKIRKTNSYIEYIGDLYSNLLKIGKGDEALLLQHILIRNGAMLSDGAKEVINNYIVSRQLLMRDASNKGVKIEYDFGDDIDVVFSFKYSKGDNGEWFVRFADGPYIRVSDIDYDKDTLSVEAYHLEPAFELSEELSSDLLGGIVKLKSFASKNGDKLDWFNSSIALFLNSYTSIRKLGTVNVGGKTLKLSHASVEKIDDEIVSYLL